MTHGGLYTLEGPYGGPGGGEAVSLERGTPPEHERTERSGGMFCECNKYLDSRQPGCTVSNNLQRDIPFTRLKLIREKVDSHHRPPAP